MNYKRNLWKLTGVLAGVVTTIGIAVPAVQSQTPIIKIDGSSTVYPITEAVAEEFQKAKRGGVRVTVGVSGTGGGFKKFCSNNPSVRTDISDASRPIKDKEKQMCAAAGVKYMAIPVAYDAITVVVHKNNPVNNITTAELKKMWEPDARGNITKWSQVNSGWPNASLTLYGPGADSGTFDYFTKKINGASGASRPDFTPSEDDNVLVKGVSNNTNALAYFGYTYYEENKNKLKALSINGVKPSMTTVRNGTYKPLSRPVYIYVNLNAVKTKPAVREFVEYYLDNASRLVPEVKSIPRTDYSASKTNLLNAIR
ncbi:MAG: PstS family phosphate ABC transporter substrate-binding protein [Nostocaceae cyanobacterium]|nr:PstS family phosphate ABC transporter substrate-binding protein [Nostocaceae cyanobacterium]